MTLTDTGTGGAKARAIPADLRALKAAAVAAKDAYYGHKFAGDKGDMDAQIAFDVEEARLMRAYSVAQDSYEQAVKAHIAAETVAA